MFKKSDQFVLWCHNLSLSDIAQQIIKNIRTSPPARRVKSGSKNVSGFFPSKKMGVTIQFESHKNELAHIRLLEDSKEVIEYYDQPNQIHLDYKSANGRRLGVNHTPDFFTIYQDNAGWEECKTEQQLLELEAHNANRYCRDSEGNWHCPPGEEYAQKLGLSYKVVSSKNISWTFQRNMEFFEDYYREDNLTVEKTKRDRIISILLESPGISLEELFTSIDNTASRDDVFSLIALNEIYVDLHKVPIVEFRHVQVFENPELAKAFDKINIPPSIEIPETKPYFDIKSGIKICWNGVWWSIANIGSDVVCLIDDNKSTTEILVSFFKEKINQKQIIVECNQTTTKNQGVNKLLLGADQEILKRANDKFEIVFKFLREGASLESLGVPERTLRHWVSLYQSAEQKCGFGYIGLLDRPLTGNRKSKISVESEECVNEFIENKYETTKQKKKQEVYDDYALFSESKGISPVSYRTFCQKVKQRSKYEQTLKRQGAKAAYKEEPLYWILEPTTPRHGERPFHIAHIDHTEIDVEMRCSVTGKELERAYLSHMIDANSRRILAKYISFERPSYRTNMMLIRECVKRFGRLPQIIVVDGGKDFASVYFDSLMAIFECTKKVRPIAKSRFGTLIERMFGTTNTQFFHNLQGNTQITKNVRHITKAVNPKALSIWNLEALDNRLSEYCYEIYDTNYHSTLGQSPREAFELGMEIYGRREFRIISYDETFLMLTLPTTVRGKAKITNRGIKINNIYYWSQSFRNPLVHGKKIQVRFDPWNVGIAYVYLNQNWIEAYSDHYTTLRNCSHKEVELACREIRQRLSLRGKHRQISARKLVEFLRSVESEEVLLIQRLRDLAQRNVMFSNNLVLPTHDSLLQPMHEDTPDDVNEDSISSDEEEIEQVDDIADFKPCELI